MAVVRFYSGTHALAALLKTPGGLPVPEALAGAEEALGTLKDEAFEALEATLTATEACFARLPEQFSEAALSELYDLAWPRVGVATHVNRPELDQMLKSFCGLIDQFKLAGRWEPDALRVHLQAFRLLLRAQLDEAAASAVVDGLRQVTDRYRAATVELTQQR